MKNSRIKRWLRRLPLVTPILKTKIMAERLVRDTAMLRASVTLELEEKCRAEAIRSAGPDSLHAFEHKVYSQNGEDGVIQEIFKRIGAPTKTFVEIGVGDGWENNTVFLIPLGWSGVWVDADPSLSSTVAGWPANLKESLKFVVTNVTAENVAGVLEGLGASREVDLLSIDVDQNTYHIWAALEEWRPRVVVVEYNGFISPAVDWKVAYDPNRVWDGSINYGASLKALERLGRRFGYRLVHCELAGVNAFFVRNDLVADKFNEPDTAEFHYELPRKSLSFEEEPSRRVLLDRDAG